MNLPGISATAATGQQWLERLKSKTGQWKSMQKRLNSSGLLLRLPPNGASYAQAKEAGQTAAAVAVLKEIGVLSGVHGCALSR
jgi:hypothetical protein